MGSIDGYWGYCSPSCSGESPSPTSKYSLTTRPNLWNLELFDLSTWGSGICYTYDPPAEVSLENHENFSGINSSLVFSARLNLVSLDSCMHYWDISEFLFFASSTKTTTTRDKVVFVDEFLGFNIYLHDRGQFWPGLEMGELI